MDKRQQLVEKMQPFIDGALAMDSWNPNQPDPHKQHAARMFGISYDEVTLEQRQAAKVNRYVYLYKMFTN